MLPSLQRPAELVPALCALCQEHPQAAGRRQLAGLLFGLIKKPNVAQVSPSGSNAVKRSLPACLLH